MRQPATMTTTPTTTWSPDRDAALTDLIRAWHRLDDLRRSEDFGARSEALLELQHARRAYREAARRVALAA